MDRLQSVQLYSLIQAYRPRCFLLSMTLRNMCVVLCFVTNSFRTVFSTGVFSSDRVCEGNMSPVHLVSSLHDSRCFQTVMCLNKVFDTVLGGFLRL